MLFFKKELTPILLIFLLALAVRLVYVIPSSSKSIVGDSYSWNAPALNIISGKGYGDTRRPPFYPLILTLLYSVFGCNILAVTIFQSFIGALNCVVIYLIGKEIFSRTAGIISALLLSFYPYLVFYTNVILSEITYAFMISLTFLLILIARKQNKIYQWVLSGISFGLTALCKPVILVSLPFISLWIYVITSEKLTAIKSIMVLCLFVLLTIIPWTVRNYLYYKSFILISTGGMDFWLSNNDVSMQLETVPEMDIPAPEKWCWYPKERYEEIMKLSRPEADKIFWKEGFNWIEKNPGKFRWLLYRRFIHLWRLWPKMATKRDKIIAKLTSGVYLPLAWFGMIFSFRQYWRKTLLLILLFVSFTLAYLPFFCMIRYRVPIDPLILVFTGYTLSIFLKSKFNKAL